MRLDVRPKTDVVATRYLAHTFGIASDAINIEQETRCSEFPHCWNSLPFFSCFFVWSVCFVVMLRMEPRNTRTTRTSTKLLSFGFRMKRISDELLRLLHHILHRKSVILEHILSWSRCAEAVDAERVARVADVF